MIGFGFRSSSFLSSSVLNSILFNFLCITLCERKGFFLPRFRKLSSETIQTDSNRFKPRAARRTTKTRKERREKRRKTTTLSTNKISLAFFLSSSSVLLSINFFFEGKQKKEKKKTSEKFYGRNQLKRTIFYILGVFTSNRSFLHKSKRALQ